MNSLEQFTTVAAIAGIAFIAYQKYHNAPLPAQNTVAAASSSNLPWFLQYNTTPPMAATIGNAGTVTVPQEAIPSASNGMQNTTNQPCTVCSIFGTAFGSTY